MRFWDTSALIPLFVEEPRSDDAWRLLRDDAVITTSAVTPIEIASALWRRRHLNELTAEEHHEADALFAMLSRRWKSVRYSQDVTNLALDVLSRHRVRSLDAIQLASCHALAREGLTLDVVAFDNRLSTAARAEGFPVLP